MTRSLACAALLAAALCARAQAPPPSYAGLPLAEQIARITSEPAVSRAHWGVSVTKLDGTPVAAMNDAQYFLPASNTKLFTTAAAITLLGPDLTFHTDVLQHGTRTGSTLTGDLILRGDGDPNLSGVELPYVAPSQKPKLPAGAPKPAKPDPLRYLAELADKVAATGVKHVTGSVIGDDQLFVYEPYPEEWTIGDAVGYDGAPVSALTVNDNAMVVTFAPGAHPGDPVTWTSAPAMPWYTFDLSDAKTTDAKTPGRIYVDRMPGSRIVRVYGSLPAGAKPQDVELAIEEPALYAAAALKMLLAERGVVVDGAARAQHRLPTGNTNFLGEVNKPLTLPASGTLSQRPVNGMPACLLVPSCPVFAPDYAADAVIASHTSYPTAVDMVLTNKVSQNLHAELFLRQMGATFGDGSTATSERVVKSLLTQRAGLDPDDFILFDGSGLSNHDLVTPRSLTKLLTWAAAQPWFNTWKPSLPVGGEDGTLASRFTTGPLKGHVFAKTGTLGEARALSGYIDCASGQTLAFSIMVSLHAPRNSDDAKAMDRILAAIAATN